jgi:hypothetical protein
MCHYYAHNYTCKHVTYVLAKYCPSANLVQTPCGKKDVWQSIRMEEECEECVAGGGGESVKVATATRAGGGGGGGGRKVSVAGSRRVVRKRK